ncbi:MAG: cupin domain-containing protein [Gammaproteobacteria bacterium]
MNDYVKKLGLERHPEGGYYGEFYRSTDNVVPSSERYEGQARATGTAIYYLLEHDDFSTFHRIKGDELWHYYDGTTPVYVHSIDEEGVFKTFLLGNPMMTEGASFTVTIRAGWWFCAELQDKTAFALMGCTVFPGFEFKDFEVANKEALVQLCPEQEEIISRMTREPLFEPSNINTIEPHVGTLSQPVSGEDEEKVTQMSSMPSSKGK